MATQPHTIEPERPEPDVDDGVMDDRLRRIIDSMADAVLVVDRDGSVQFANPAAEALFEKPREEMAGDHFGFPVGTGETVELDLQGGRVAEMRVVELDWAGEPAWLASLRDITDRKEAEKAARRLWRERMGREQAEHERRRLHELLERAPAAILTADGDDHVCRFANPGMAALVPGRKLEGRPLGEALSDIAGQGFLEGLEETWREGTGRGISELELRLAPGIGEGGDGETRYLDVSWEPLRDDGRVRGVMCFAHDITSQVRMRRELEHAMRRLREEEQRKDQFMAVLGHELRNPLAGIGSGLRLLQNGADEEQERWALTMMDKQVNLLSSLLDDLLDISRIARDKLELRRQPVPLTEIVDAAVASVRQRLEEREQTIDCHLPVEPVVSLVDAERMEQVITNLLVNASKYSPPGTTIRLVLTQEGDEAVVEVDDEGIGIETELLGQIFEPFIQGQKSSPLAGGLGIGLTLVKQIVELHGGSVSASSPGEDQGSTFRVRLPVTEERPEPPGDDSLDEDRRELQGLRVLVVDDNEDASRALAELLEITGCETTTAATGKEALARAREIRPAVILLDLDLPDLSGYEVAEEVREDPGIADALLIAVSGFGHEKARERSKESGIDHHLVKPVQVETLVEHFAAHRAD